MQNGVLKTIKIFYEKNCPPEIVKNAVCLVDCGLQGDRFAKGGEKQLTVIDTQCENWLREQEEKGLCFDRFKANLTVENIDLSQLKSGDVLDFDGVLLQISNEGKECFPECTRVQNGCECLLRSHAKYLKVIKGGTIKAADRITCRL